MARLPRSGDDVAVQEAMVSPVEEEGGEDHADLLFLVTTFLSGLPLGREAANVLARDLEQGGAFGDAYDWQGNKRSASFDDLRRRLRSVPGDQLVRIMKAQSQFQVSRGGPPHLTSQVRAPQSPAVLIDASSRLVDLCVQRTKLRTKRARRLAELQLLERRVATEEAQRAARMDGEANYFGEHLPEGQEQQRELGEVGAERRVADLKLLVQSRLPLEISKVSAEIDRLARSPLPAAFTGVSIPKLLENRMTVSHLPRPLITRCQAASAGRDMSGGKHGFSLSGGGHGLMSEKFEHLATKSGHLTWPVYCLRYDRTGQYLMTGADDHLVKIWSATSGALISTLRGHLNVIMDLAVSYDNSLLATASADKLIRIWWLRNGAPVTVLRQDAIINCICFDPSSNILISAADDGRCCVWDLRDILRVVEEGAPRVDLSMRHPQTGEAVNIKCLGLSPVGGIFAVGCSDGVAHVWKYGDRPKAPASSPLATSPPELSASPSLALTLAPPAHPSEPIVFGGCTLVLEPLMRLEGHLSGLSDISFSMLGDRLLTGSMDDGTARVWSWGRAYRGLRHVVLMASQHEHASRVAGVGSAGGRVKGNTGRRGGGAGSRGPKTVLDNVVWTCDDTRIITSQSAKNLRPGIDESRQKIKVWDSFTGQLLLQWNAHMRGASSMSSNPSHPDCLVTVGADGDVCVWDALSGKGIKTFQNLLLSGPAGNEHSHGDKVGNLDVEFSPDGSSFAVADKLGRWSLYGLGSRLQEMQVGRRVPSEQYFMSDYSECIMDAQNNVLDGRTQLPTHISPRGPLINSQAIPYPLQQQPDQKKLLGPLPLSRRELSIIAAVDEWHRSRLETLLEDYEDRGFERRVAWRRLSLYHSTQEASSDAWRNARRAGTNSSLRQGSRGGSAAQRGNEEVDMAMLDHLESEAEESEVDADALSGDSEYEEAERNFARPVSTRLRTYGYRLGDGSGSDDGNAQDNGSARRRRRGRRMVSASSGDEDRHAELSSDDDSDAGSPALSSDGDEDNTDRVLADSQEHVDEEDRLPQVSRSVKPREAQPVPDQFDSAIIAIEPINGDESAAAGDADGSEVEGSAEGDPQARGANGLNPAASSQEIENVDRSTLRCAFCGFGDSEGSPLPGPGLGPHPLIAGKKRMWVHDDCAEQSPLTCVDALGNWCNVVKEVRRGAQLLCTGCRASGATIGCFIASCSHNYHFPCAVETGWEFTRSSTPFNVPVAFHCRKHRRGLNSTSAGSLVREAEANARSSLLLAQLPHESSADRSWLMKDKVTASDLYCPQVGDEVIYFPQGHKKHLEMVPLGVAAPWSRFSSKTPAALCTVTEVKYGFPGENEYSISRSVVVLIKLTVGGFFPAHAAEDRNGTDDEGGAPPLPFGEMAKMAARVDDWPAPSDGLSFHVYLRSCSQPDFLVLKQQFVDSLSQDLNPGMRIEALFQEGASNEAIAHGGVIHAINARDDEFGWSPWECLHIVWDGSDADANGGGDDLCPWEVCLLAEDGTSNWPSRPSLEKGLSNRLLSAVQEVASSQLAEFFRDPVDLYLHPNYGCYVPVPMDLGKIQRRLKNGYYRTFDAIKDDCRLIYMNCASYNKRGSAIVKTAQNLSRRLSQDLNRAKGANEDEGGEDGGCEGNDIGDSSQPSGKRGRSGREVANSDGSESDGSLEGSGAHGSPGRKQSRGNKRTCRRSQSSADEDKYHYAPVSNAGPLPWKGRPLRAGTPQGNGAARGAAIARSSRSSSRRSSRAHKLPGRFTYEDGDSDDHMDDAEREEQSKEDLARARARRLAARTQLSPAPAVVPAQTATRPRRKGAQEEEAVQASESEAEMSSGSVAKGSKTRSLASPGPGQRRRRGSYKEPKDEFDDEEVSEATPVKRTRGRWAVKRAMRGREVKDEEEEEEEEEEDSSEESDVWEKAPVRGSASRSNGRRRSKTRASRKDGHEQAGQDEEEEEVHSTQETPAKKVAGGRRHAGRAPRLKENPLKSLLCEFRQELSASKVLELVRTVSTEDWMGAPNGNLKRAGLDLLDRMNELDPFEVFASPVTEEVEGYLDVIRNPMDFSTIRSKLESEAYASQHDLRDDLVLTFANCMAFNKGGSELFNLAKDMTSCLSAEWENSCEALKARRSRRVLRN